MVTDFGATAAGDRVARVVLRSGGLEVALLTLGAVLQSLRLAGIDRDLTLGSPRLADYEADMIYHGAIVGPVANRISGAAAVIGGQVHQFEANEGPNTLHSGPSGAHARVWDIADRGSDFALLRLALPDGAGGFPGNRALAARFSVTGTVLRLELSAETDAPTLMNLANHSYWNLDGTPDFSGHRLRIAAEGHVAVGPDLLPTGEVAAVAGTDLDFRHERVMTPGAPPLDTCFCLSPGREGLREVLWLQGASGVRMALATTEPGVQVYDARDARRPGAGPHEGLAIEAQFWPDAVRHTRFPPILLRPGEPWVQVTEWRFAAG
jgi:aldose 1-epimerase